MDIWRIIITCTVVFISCLTLYYMYVFKREGNIENILNKAVDSSTFNPMIFKIYDKSTKDTCNRLIIVEPFDWHIWACRGELYILNPEGGIHCSNNTTPAIQVIGKQFHETCLNLDIDSIIKSYTIGQTPHIVPYEIKNNTFTILSALNILVKNYITYNDTDKNTTFNIKLHNIYSHRTRRSLPSLNERVQNFEKPQAYRPLSSNSVIQITNRRPMQDLQRFYEQHVGGMRPKPKYLNTTEYRVADLDPNDLAYITLRQHAIDSDDPKNWPKLIQDIPEIKPITTTTSTESTTLPEENEPTESSSEPSTSKSKFIRTAFNGYLEEFDRSKLIPLQIKPKPYRFDEEKYKRLEAEDDSTKTDDEI